MQRRRSFRLASGLWPLAFMVLACTTADTVPYDLVITNARIVDGTGNPWYYGDVGIRGDRIATIAPRNALATEPASERIDAGGLALSPGFIDIQSHSWSALLYCRPAFVTSS